MAAQSGRKSAIAVLPDYLFARDNVVVYILYNIFVKNTEHWYIYIPMFSIIINALV